MTRRTNYLAKIKAEKWANEQSKARTEPYPELDKEERNLLRKVQDDLEESLHQSKHDFMQYLQLAPTIKRKEPNDEFFTTKIYLRKRNQPEVFPRCTCVCWCGTGLALWRAKRRQIGKTHAKVRIMNTQ